MKIFKIICINTIVIFVLFLITEVIMVIKWKGTIPQYFDSIFHSISVDDYYSMLYEKKEVENAFTTKFRPDENISSKKKPILIMGCSFAYGDGIEENETVSALLAKHTGRPVYNRAGMGWGLAQLLYQTRRNDFYSQIPEPEYMIYIYIENHKSRLDKFKIEPTFIDFQPKYKEKNNHLIEEKPHWYDRLYFISTYQYNYNYLKNKVTNDIVSLYFQEAEDAIRSNWKNTKLVILYYPTDSNCCDLDKNITGFQIIDITKIVNVDLTKNEYKVDGWHPTAEAWQIITPKIIEILNL